MLEKARTALLTAYHRIEGQLPPDEIDRRRNAFLSKYAPEHLGSLAGTDLIRAVHGDGSRRGLFYDLEFAPLFSSFGGIGGGSALKFKVYVAADGSGFRKKGHGSVPARCSDSEAEQITAGIVRSLCKALAAVDEYRLPSGDLDGWQKFERYISSDSTSSSALGRPDTPTPLLGWAHKYLAICRPDAFSFHHQPRQLAVHLVRLGELPQDGATRYLLDRQWLRLRAADRDYHTCHPVLLMRAAYDAFGRDTKYWRISTDEHNEHGEIDRWPAMRRGGYVSIGYSSIADLKELIADSNEQVAREQIKQALSTVDEELQPSARSVDRWAADVYDFYAKMRPGDRIAALRGRCLLSVGEVTGEYAYDPGDVHPHRRSVAWRGIAGEDWPEPPGQTVALAEFSRRYPDALRVELLLAVSDPLPAQPPVDSLVRETADTETVYRTADPGSVAKTPIAPLSPFELRVKEILDRKGQVILYGPPGTGKTYNARRTARELSARETCHGRAWAMLSSTERRRVDESIEFITLHPAYAYEDFVEGYRPAAPKGGPAFVLRNGIFLDLCDVARQNPDRHRFLIIDELNRGNLAAVIGELITLLEFDKRDTVEAILPLSRSRFRIPRNVWIIGTMNTADRSVAMLDAALRRRFGFIEMLPDYELIAVEIDHLSLADLLTEINLRIRTYITRNARELQVGHAYFMRDGRPIRDKQALLALFRDEILPLLAEYCFENYAMLARILGDEIIDAAVQAPNAEVFRSADRLHGALQRLLSSDSALRAHPNAPDDDEERVGLARLTGVDGGATRSHSVGTRRDY